MRVPPRRAMVESAMRRPKTTTRKTLTKRNAQGTPIFEVLRLPDDRWGHTKMQRERVQRLIWEAGAWSTWAMHLSLHGHSRVADPAEGKRATAVARALSALAAAYVFDDPSLQRKGREAAKELRTSRMVDLRDLEWGEGGWLHCFSDPFVDGGKGGNRRAALERERLTVASSLASGCSSDDLADEFVFTTSFPMSGSACDVLPSHGIPVTVDVAEESARKDKVRRCFARYLRDKRPTSASECIQIAERLIVQGYIALGVPKTSAEGLFDFEN
jgi:hypothetical protein